MKKTLKFTDAGAADAFLDWLANDCEERVKKLGRSGRMVRIEAATEWDYLNAMQSFRDVVVVADVDALVDRLNALEAAVLVLLQQLMRLSEMDSNPPASAELRELAKKLGTKGVDG